MNRAEAAVQALYEDSRLREDLIDDEADVLLQWAEKKLIELDESDVDDTTWQQAVTTFKGLMRGVNQFIGQRAYATYEAQNAAYETIQAQAAALNLPLPEPDEPQFSAQMATDDALEALKALLGQMDAGKPRMTKAGEPQPTSGGERLNLFGTKTTPDAPEDDATESASDTQTEGGARLNLFGTKTTPDKPTDDATEPASDTQTEGGERFSLFGLHPKTDGEPEDIKDDADQPKTFGDRFSPFGDRSKPDTSTMSGRSGGEAADDEPSGSGEGE